MLKFSADLHVGKITLPYRDVKISLHHVVTPSIRDPPDMGLYATVIKSSINDNAQLLHTVYMG